MHRRFVKKKTWAFCFQLRTVAHFVGFISAVLAFLFLDFLPLQLNQIWGILCVMYGEKGGWDFVYFLFVFLLGKVISYNFSCISYF
jgi:hypothetical protein